MKFIISGYVGVPGKSIGLYYIENGKFSGKGWQASVETPSYVCEGDGYVFAATEASDKAAFHSFKDGALTDSLNFDDGYLCHIAYSDKHKMLYGACYGTGNIVGASFDPRGGKFGKACVCDSETGRAHSVLLNKAQTKLYAANIALDIIFIYDIIDGKLIKNGGLAAGKGRGPRHMALSADESKLYVITEYSNEIIVFDVGTENILQTISTLPQNTEGKNNCLKSNCSTLCFAADGKSIYGANRYTDTVASFILQDDGLLKYTGIMPCGGKTPRHMAVSSDGKSVIVCNQQSDSVDIIELSTGMKTDSIYFTKPAGIVELR